MIKVDVRKDVQELFKCGRIYLAMNCALVTLIPKTPNAKTIREMSPISCCTTLYKIISKVLIARLSRVIHEKVDESQSTFIHGKVIHGNIII